MTSYIVILFILLLNAIIDYLLKHKYAKVILALSCIMLFFYSAFRYDVGIDYINYAWTGRTISKINNIPDMIHYIQTSGIEVGFVIACKIFNVFFHNFQCVFITMSFLVFLLLYKGIKKFINEKFYLLSMILFSFLFYANSMNISRQYVAVLICFYSIRYISDKEMIKFFISIVIASLFHVSAIFFLPAYIVNKIKVNKKTVIMFMFLIFFFAFFFEDLVGKVLNLGILYTEYSMSAKSGTYKSILLSIIMLIPLTYSYIVYKSKLNSLYDVMFKLVLFGMLMNIFSIQVFYITRISLYYRFSIIIVLPILISLYRIKANRLILVTLYSLLLIAGLPSSLEELYTNDKVYTTNPYINLLEGQIKWRENVYGDK